jgi:hypothetical protein
MQTLCEQDRLVHKGKELINNGWVKTSICSRRFMKIIFLGLLSILSIQASFADLTCKEYEATISLKDSWVGCQLQDRFAPTRSSSIIAEFYVAPEVNSERYSNAYYYVNGGNDATSGIERSTLPEKVTTSIVTDSEIEFSIKAAQKKTLQLIRFSVLRKNNSNLFGVESFVAPFGGDVEIQFPHTNLFGKVRWSSANNGRFGLTCSLNTPVEFEDSIARLKSCSANPVDARKCLPYQLWNTYRNLTGETVEASWKTYYKPNAEGKMECYIKH